MVPMRTTGVDLKEVTLLLADQSLSLLRADGSPFSLAEAALLSAYRYSAYKEDGAYSDAVDSLDDCIAALTDLRKPFLGLRRGLSGVGWTVEHLSHLLRIDEKEPGPTIDSEEDPLGTIDDLFQSYLDSNLSWSSLTRMMTLVDFAVYYLERWPRPTALFGLTHIGSLIAKFFDPAVFQLDKAQSQGDLGWRQLTCYQPAAYGLLHGLAAFTSLVTSLVSVGSMPGSGSGILASCVWLLSNELERRLSSKKQERTPFRAGGESYRIGWCCGDLGLAFSIYRAGKESGDPTWRSVGAEWIKNVNVSVEEQLSVVDASLDHGALGIAHLCRRIEEYEPQFAYSDIIEGWVQRALATRIPKRGIGGFTTWRTTKRPFFFSDHSLYSGTTGLALAMLSLTNQVDPSWDRPLFGSMRKL